MAPHLIHKGRRVTTNATLKTDLEQSVVLTLVARIETLEKSVSVINEHLVTLNDTMKVLVTRSERVMTAMARVVARAEEHLDAEDAAGDVQ